MEGLCVCVCECVGCVLCVGVCECVCVSVWGVCVWVGIYWGVCGGGIIINISTLMVPFERYFSKRSENYKIIEIRSMEFKLCMAAEGVRTIS